MNEAIVVSLITGMAAILVAWLTSRNKATQASVDVLRAELKACKENNERDREDFAAKLKEALEEKNRLFDENLKLMQKILLDTHPKIKSRRKL